MKYSGLDSGGNAIKDFFASNNSACDCFDISVTYSAMGQDYTSEIEFSQYICDMKLFGNMSAIDFLKMILRCVTAIFCVFMIIRTVGIKTEAKK